MERRVHGDTRGDRGRAPPCTATDRRARALTYLLDTNVLSEIRKDDPAPSVAAWWASVSPSDLYLSVLVIGEIRRGIELLRRRRDHPQAGILEQWLIGLKRDYQDRTIPVAEHVAEAWGRLDAQSPIPTIDGLLAATALVHGLILVTREAKLLERTGVPVLDPWL